MADSTPIPLALARSGQVGFWLCGPSLAGNGLSLAYSFWPPGGFSGFGFFVEHFWLLVGWNRFATHKKRRSALRVRGAARYPSVPRPTAHGSYRESQSRAGDGSEGPLRFCQGELERGRGRFDCAVEDGGKESRAIRRSLGDGVRKPTSARAESGKPLAWQ